MDAPHIQYATSADGTRIACYRIGSGPPLISFSPMPSHLRVAWETASERADALRWSQNFSLIKFDMRGSGLSQRGQVTHSLQAYVEDTAAVLDTLGFERVSLNAPGGSARQAVAFAAQHPDRVDKLVLFSAFVSATQLATSPKATGLMSLLEHDYEMFTETAALAMYGWSTAMARDEAAIMRAAQTRDEAIAWWTALDGVDARPLLPLVRARTLVIDVRSAEIVPSSVAHTLAAEIPDARLMVIEGNVPSGDMTNDEGNRAVRSFLVDDDVPRVAAQFEQPARARASTEIILFADIASSTALTERLGDAEFRDRSRGLETAIRREVQAAGGNAVEGKVMGDGVMATFPSAMQAIEAALACMEASARHELPLHTGVHAGDVLREGGNVYGGAVNLAARVCDASAPGEILVSEVVRALARTSAGVTFEDRGEHALKGIEEPQRLYAVRAEG